tara:strand:+ start:1204 stop:1533 length:330 start_codon:yes stop_codon:yes gene_type:complete
MKFCRTCNEKKQQGQFYTNVRYKSGYDSECINCKLSHQKKRIKNARNHIIYINEEYFTKDQVSTFLSIGLSSVSRLHDRVPPIRDGKRNLYLKRDIERLLLNSQTGIKK